MLLRRFVQLVNTFIPLLQEFIIVIKILGEVLIKHFTVYRSIVQSDSEVLRSNLLKNTLEYSFCDCKGLVGLHDFLSFSWLGRFEYNATSSVVYSFLISYLILLLMLYLNNILFGETKGSDFRHPVVIKPQEYLESFL